MRRWAVLSGLVVVLAACAPGDAVSTTTVPPIDTTTTTVAAPTSTVGVTTTTAPPPGGHLVRLDSETLQPAEGLEPIPLGNDSWGMLVSRDGSVLVHVECGQNLCDQATAVDLVAWESWGTIDVGSHQASAVDQSTFYGYDGRFGSTGRGLFSVDLVTGVESSVGEWPHSLSLWDGLHVQADGGIAAIAHAPSDVVDNVVANYSVYLYEPSSDETMEIEVGPLTRGEEHSGVFDGDYEIPVWDTPGLAWGDDHLYMVHAEDLVVTEVDLATGQVETHALGGSSLWERLWAFWIPPASAKGPSIGTYSSAALSPNGRYLYVSGNRSAVETSADGSLVEVQDHLGVTVIDTETWNLVASPDLAIQFVHEIDGMVIGVDTTSTTPWVDEAYLLEVDDAGEFDYRGPIPVPNGGWCEPTPDHAHLLCTSHQGPGDNLLLIDVETMEVVNSATVGQEDIVRGIGVLVDWRPQEQP